MSKGNSLRPISRRLRPSNNPATTLDEIAEADRKYFDENPDEEEYIREFVPGEFGAAELPEIPPGFRYTTHVSVLYHDGEQVGRYRSMMTVCDGEELKRLAAS